MNTGRADKARESFRPAREILQKLISDYPDPNCQSDLLNVFLNEAVLFRGAGQLQNAKKKHEQGMVLAKKKAVDYPSYPESEFDLAQQQHEFGNTLVVMGHGSEAELIYRKSIDSLNQLLKLIPGQQIYKKEQALCWIDLGLLQESVNKEKEAEEAFAKAAAIFDELVQGFPAANEFQAELANSLYQQARLSAKKGEREPAGHLLERTIEFHNSVAHKNPSKPEYSNIPVPRILAPGQVVRSSRQG